MKRLFRKMMKNRRGISPILATLLLVVIAVAAIVVTYAWLMTYVNHTTQQASSLLTYANVNFLGNGTRIEIDIQNSGTAAASIIQVYVGTSSSAMDNVTMSPAPPVQINAGTIQSITVGYAWTSGNTYYFKIIPSTGQPLPWNQQAQ